MKSTGSEENGASGDQKSPLSSLEILQNDVAAEFQQDLLQAVHNAQDKLTTINDSPKGQQLIGISYEDARTVLDNLTTFYPSSPHYCYMAGLIGELEAICYFYYLGYSIRWQSLLEEGCSFDLLIEKDGERSLVEVKRRKTNRPLNISVKKLQHLEKALLAFNASRFLLFVINVDKTFTLEFMPGRPPVR
ncbi:MAG: hypothetical protein ACE5OZ_18345 [Candidatus Heimdallarchaeota archaeon]